MNVYIEFTMNFLVLFFIWIFESKVSVCTLVDGLLVDVSQGWCVCKEWGVGRVCCEGFLEGLGEHEDEKIG